jgi:hypothetical protein
LKNNNDISINQVGNAPPPNYNILLSIKYTNGAYMIRPKIGETFLVFNRIRSIRDSSYPLGYKLNKRDILKLGFAKLQVKEIFKHSFNNVTETKVFDKCKICESETKEDKLIQPCYCIEGVHLNCMRNWCKDRIILKTEYSCIINELCCDVCGKILTIEFCQKYNLLGLQTKDSFYIIFNSLNEEKRVYVVRITEEKTIKIVRVLNKY